MNKLIKNYKQLHDNVHGFIKISNIACLIIDSPEFQRLRYLHQLGTCYFVFHSATHMRFEHSVGTYYLAGRLLDNIVKNSDINEINNCLNIIPELNNYYKKINCDSTYLKLDDFVIELIKIAALCHDIGHGPFSHCFDDIFISSLHDRCEGEIKHELELHENRSIFILKHIINKNELLKDFFGENEISFISNLINPDKSHQGFVYQIVSNDLNSIDVDKYDYMTRDTATLGLQFKFDPSRLLDNVRVISNTICFPEKVCFDVASIFEIRYRLHKQIYCHKTVISIQYMIRDIMLLLNPILKIYDSIFNVDKFCELTDDYILSSVKFLYNNLEKYSSDEQILIKKAKNILDNIHNRKLYKLIIYAVFDSYKPQLDKLYNKYVIMHYGKIGFVSGNKKNPFDNLYFYRDKTPTICNKISKDKISALIPNNYQEHIYIFLSTNKELSEDDKNNIISTVHSLSSV